MRCIYKFPLKIADEQSIDLPANAKILTVQMQGPQLCMWVLVDPEDARRKREVYIVGTGNPCPDDAADSKYVGSVQERSFVWHVFIR